MAIACGMAFGTVLAVCAVVRVRALNAFARAYVTLFRSIPLVMLLLWFFLIVPQLLKSIFDLSPSVDIRLVSAMVAFSMLEAAFFRRSSGPASWACRWASFRPPSRWA